MLGDDGLMEGPASDVREIESVSAASDQDIESLDPGFRFCRNTNGLEFAALCWIARVGLSIVSPRPNGEFLSGGVEFYGGLGPRGGNQGPVSGQAG